MGFLTPHARDVAEARCPVRPNQQFRRIYGQVQRGQALLRRGRRRLITLGTDHPSWGEFLSGFGSPPRTAGVRPRGDSARRRAQDGDDQRRPGLRLSDGSARSKPANSPTCSWSAATPSTTSATPTTSCASCRAARSMTRARSSIKRAARSVPRRGCGRLVEGQETVRGRRVRTALSFPQETTQAHVLASALGRAWLHCRAAAPPGCSPSPTDRGVT